MRLEDEQYEEIKRTVIDTFSLYGIRCIPISAFEMATKMGIKVIPYSALSEEKRSAAMRESKDGFSIGSSQSQEWMIFYNDACESYGRINQTIMHEIGHYAMGHHPVFPVRFFRSAALGHSDCINHIRCCRTCRRFRKRRR